MLISGELITPTQRKIKMKVRDVDLPLRQYIPTSEKYT